MMVLSWVWEVPLEEGMTTHSSILAWKIPWTEEPGGLQSVGSQGVRHDQAINTGVLGPCCLASLYFHLRCYQPHSGGT